MSKYGCSGRNNWNYYYLGNSLVGSEVILLELFIFVSLFKLAIWALKLLGRIFPELIRLLSAAQSFYFASRLSDRLCFLSPLAFPEKLLILLIGLGTHSWFTAGMILTLAEGRNSSFCPWFFGNTIAAIAVAEEESFDYP